MSPCGYRQALAEEIKKSLLTPWILLFLVLAFSVTQFGGTNALSRIAALRAITENGSLNIDRYKDWTKDWSLSPNGHYYSNKAPGAVFFALPVFALLDFPLRALPSTKKDEFGRAPQPPYIELLLLNLLAQALPFSLLMLAIGKSLRLKQLSQLSILYFALAALFGNTASLYLNCFFGHGMAGLFFLAGFACWLARYFSWSGFFLAATALTDYSGCLLVPFFLLATLWRERNFHPLWRIAAGASPIALVWILFHALAFGNPFAVASAFINPDQVEAATEVGGQKIGAGFLPSPAILWSLLFGSERGLLATQPWIFAVVLLFFSRARQSLPKGSALFLGGGLAALLWMNASVPGWAGGWTLGPRYICLIFPAFALAGGLMLDQAPAFLRLFALATLGVALAFRLLVFPFSNLAPPENLWLYHWRLYFASTSGTPWLRLGIGLLATALTTFWAWRRAQKARRV